MRRAAAQEEANSQSRIKWQSDFRGQGRLPTCSLPRLGPTNLHFHVIVFLHLPSGVCQIPYFLVYFLNLKKTQGSSLFSLAKKTESTEKSFVQHAK